MFKIKKISQRYDSREDRIEVAIQNDTGQVIRLWLTQRLSNKMVSILSKLIPEQQEKSKELSTNPLNESEINQSRNNKELAVDYSSAAEEGLLTTIDISSSQNDYTITFKWGVIGAASIYMGIEQIDCFFDGLIRLYELAKWNLNSFPATKLKTTGNKKPIFDDFPDDNNTAFKKLH